jgi:hypothetical protein
MRSHRPTTCTKVKPAVSFSSCSVSRTQAIVSVTRLWKSEQSKHGTLLNETSILTMGYVLVLRRRFHWLGTSR